MAGSSRNSAESSARSAKAAVVAVNRECEHDYSTAIEMISTRNCEPRSQSATPRDAFNVVYPAWELSKYPAVWAEQLDKFDEVWTASTFTQQSIAPAVNKPVLHVSEPGEIKLKSFLGRRYFGIPESSFVFLFFFDFTSYLDLRTYPGCKIKLTIGTNATEPFCCSLARRESGF